MASRVAPGYVGFITPEGWHLENQALYGELGALACSDPVAWHLRAHPVQEGVIDANNFYFFHKESHHA